MKRLLTATFVGLAISGLVMSSFFTVQAIEEPKVLTEKQIEAIANQCLASKVALDKLHTTDALLRVNLGQQYENISSRLMAPFNSRVALNAHDGVDLTKTTVDFNKTLDEFRTDYRAYESSVDTALNIDCETRPVDYYAAIENAREQRVDLHSTTSELNQLVKQYRQQFEAFSKRITQEKTS